MGALFCCATLVRPVTLGATPSACVTAVVCGMNGMFFALFAFLLSGRDQPSFYAMAGVAAGVYLFYRGFRTLARKRLILDTPSSKIRSASLGLVEVSGQAVGPYTLPAPITGVACYFHHTVAWQLRQAGKNKEWQKVAEESMHLPFFLDDNTGLVLVDPQDAVMDIHRDFHQEFGGAFFGTGDEAPVNVLNFLARHGVANDHRLRVDEYCIKPKNALFVLGTLMSNSGQAVTSTPVRTSFSGTLKLNNLSPNLPSSLAASLAEGLNTSTTVTVHRTLVVNTMKGDLPQEIIRLTSDDKPGSASDMTQQGKIAAALTKAGISSPAVWAAAGLATGVAAAPTSGGVTVAPAASTDFDLHPAVVLGKGEHNPAFFISWRSQKEIVQSLGWQSTAMIWGGPAIALLCLYYLLEYLRWL